jgi:tetratricopeptide (TPR) repeat protein
MRFIRWIAVLVMVLLLPAAVSAQDAPAAQPTTPPTSTDDMLDEMQALVIAARDHAEDASRYANDASNFLNIFEGIGLAITVGAVVLGLVGFNQLFSARAQLQKSRQEDQARLDKALADFTLMIKAKEDEVDALSQQLVQNAQEQRDQLAQAQHRFEDEINRKEHELNALKEMLQQAAEHQRQEAARATLALSLLPLGERQYRAQDFQGAMDTYFRALELDEDNPIIHYRLGYIRFQIGELEEAEKHLMKALEIEPQFPLALAALGYVYRRRAEKMPESLERDLLMNKAEKQLLEALNFSPKLLDEDGESWWGSLGGLYRRRGQNDQAIAAYRRAAEVTPFSSYPFSNLAMLYSDRRDIESTLRAFAQVERLAHDEALAEVGNYWGYADLLTARLVLGKVHEAEDALISVLYTAPSVYALQTLAETLERLMGRLGGETGQPHIAAFLPRLRAEISRREADGVPKAEMLS